MFEAKIKNYYNDVKFIFFEYFSHGKVINSKWFYRFYR
jgi:hypothetical protein